MHDLTILNQLAVIFAVAVAVVLLLGRIGVPTIAGMILAGVLAGPNGLGIVTQVEGLETLAEVGVVLLLFTIGLEFSPDRIRRIWKLVTLGGGLQVVLTAGATAALVLALGRPLGQALFAGFLMALSSTAIVLRALTERGETDAPHGRIIVGVLIFQDVCIVPMMLLVPMLAGDGSVSAADFALSVGGALLMVVVVFVGARIVVPPLLKIIAMERKRELFVLAVMLVCIGTAWLISLAGMSLAMGAFLAGVVLAGSGYGNQAMSDVLPFRDSFASLFFISIGMLMDLRVLVEQPLLVGGLFLLILIGKFSIATVAALCMRFPLRVALLTGVGLAQVGEFSFVLGKAGEAVGLMTAEESRIFLAASVLTMIITPILVRFAPHFAAGMARLNPLERVFGGHGADEVEPEHPRLRDHVIIAGFGLAGRALATSLKRVNIPYIVLELNPASVDRHHREGEPIYYGDITSSEVLHHCHYQEARELVLVISDPAATRRAVSAVRALAPELHITVRTRYFDEITELQQLGATDVVVEEFENAVELMARVLRRAGTPRNVIAARIADARESRPELMRPLTLPRQRLMHFAEVMKEVKLDNYLMSAEDWAVGRSCHEINLRSVTGASVVALRRGEKIIPNPSPREQLQTGDIVYLLGDQPSVTGAMMFFQTGHVPQAEAQDSAEDTQNP